MSDIDPNYDPYTECFPEGKPNPFLRPAMDVLLAKMDEMPVLAELTASFIYSPVPTRVVIHPDLEKEWFGDSKD